MAAANNEGHRPRVLVTKLGLDGHDRGSRLVATYLRDAGAEVIYTGPWQDIPVIVVTAVDEDVDLIGISSLATDHLLIPRLMAALAGAGLGDLPVVVGGIIPQSEITALREAGVSHVFHPGATRDEIVDRIVGLIAGQVDSVSLAGGDSR
ncbi:MAG: cobalamin B12-binding domain-containing protein [Acidimicrobiia bacterium]